MNTFVVYCMSAIDIVTGLTEFTVYKNYVIIYMSQSLAIEYESYML